MSQGHFPRLDAPTEEQIRAELVRVLASHEFRSSKRCQDFLQYVVDHTLRGRADTLKERTIGMEVFARPASYDPSEDATVRVKAGEVRKRLGLYYSDQGARDAVRIELPSGTYVPEFHASTAATEAPPVPAPVEMPLAPQAPATAPAPSSRRLWLVFAGLAALAVAAVGWRYQIHAPRTMLDEFWAPVLKGSSPVSVCAAFVPVWNLDRDPKATGPGRPEDYVELTDQFVGGGDLIATSRLVAMLTRLGRPYRVKVGNEVSFPDLRTGPAILVGYSYTRWREISSQMRYFIDAAQRPLGIMDNGRPTEWTLHNLPRDRRTAEDYAIVSRVFHPDTRAMLVELAGITQYGTDAAAELVTNSDLMAQALRDAPRDWQRKNLQIVLHVKVIAGSPTAPAVVKSHYW
jgi:hypothetical protein